MEEYDVASGMLLSGVARPVPASRPRGASRNAAASPRALRDGRDILACPSLRYGLVWRAVS